MQEHFRLEPPLTSLGGAHSVSFHHYIVGWGGLHLLPIPHRLHVFGISDIISSNANPRYASEHTGVRLSWFQMSRIVNVGGQS